MGMPPWTYSTDMTLKSVHLFLRLKFSPAWGQRKMRFQLFLSQILRLGDGT